MIGRLRGVMAERGDNGSCVLDVGGVGYEVFVPAGHAERLSASREPVTLHVHTHVREESLVLYGFETLADRTAFRAVLGVSGVGPKTALAVVSALPAGDLSRAVALGDKAVFKGIPGVGKKTVDRMLLDLADKLPALGEATSQGHRPATRELSGPLGIVAGALVQMGYKQAQADHAVASIEAADGRSVEDLLREALTALG